MKLSLVCSTLVSLSWLAGDVSGFAVLPTPRFVSRSSSLSAEAADKDVVDVDAIVFSNEEEKKKAVGNLVADDEWMGLGMELSEAIRVAVVEDLKQNARDFLGKDEYKIGDISKEIDERVKSEGMYVALFQRFSLSPVSFCSNLKLLPSHTNSVATLRGKEDYELGDFVLSMDEMAKNMTENLTGKEYEPGDLSVELDKRIKNTVAEWSGKDEYEFGDLSREIAKRVHSRVEEFTGKPYEFGDVTREVENRRKEWVTSFLGEEAAKNYQFGDVTKKFINNFTGKDEYQFGDLSKKLMGDLFGKRKKKSDT